MRGKTEPGPSQKSKWALTALSVTWPMLDLNQTAIFDDQGLEKD